MSDDKNEIFDLGVCQSDDGKGIDIAFKLRVGRLGELVSERIAPGHDNAAFEEWVSAAIGDSGGGEPIRASEWPEVAALMRSRGLDPERWTLKDISSGRAVAEGEPAIDLELTRLAPADVNAVVVNGHVSVEEGEQWLHGAPDSARSVRLVRDGEGVVEPIATVPACDRGPEEKATLIESAEDLEGLG